MQIQFTVPGEAVTQGSMAVVKGKVVHSKRRRKDGTMPMTVMQWRRIVKSYAGAAMSDIAMEPWDGPAAVRVVFYLRKPKEPHCNTSPDTKPDLDKLLRALGDALEGSVVTQDSRIVEWSGIKRWARPGEERVDVEVALL